MGCRLKENGKSNQLVKSDYKFAEIKAKTTEV